MMKKQFYLLSIVILGLIVSFSACKKEDVLNEKKQLMSQSENGLTFEDDRLVFNSIEDYEKFVSNTEYNDAILRFKQLNKNSLALLNDIKSDGNEDYDPFLLNMLSIEKTFQVGDWIIKVNKEEETVSVLNVADFEYYNDLVCDNENKRIYYFSTNDDVIDILNNEEYVKYNRGWFCRDRQAKSKKDESYLSDGLRRCNVHYYKAGVYFSLSAQIYDAQSSYIGSMRTNYSIKVGRKFDDRCNRSYDRLTYGYEYKSGSFPGGCDNTGGGRYCTKRVYQSMRQLKNYRIDAWFTVTYIDMYGGNAGTVASRKYSISDY